MTFEDQEEFDLCGVLYKATRQQANEIFDIMIDTQEWLNYTITNERLRYGEFEAISPGAAQLVAQHVENYRKAFKTAKKIIETYLQGTES
jgi:hypothetical protein